MTVTSIASIEASLRAQITTNGTNTVRLSKEVLEQMNAIVERVRKVSLFAEENLTEHDLDLAQMTAEKFSNSSIGYDIVDGWLQLEPEDRVEEIMASMEEQLSEVPHGFLLPVFLVNKILNEEKKYVL